MEERRISPKQLALGYSSFGVINLLIKFTLDPYIVHEVNKNIWESYFFIFLFSFFIRYSMIFAYDKIKIDWLAIEGYKAKRKDQGKDNHTIKLIKKLKKFGNGFLIFALACIDPMITILIYRPGYLEWNGFKGNHKKIPFTKIEFPFNSDTKILFLLSNIACSIITGSIVLGFVKIF